MSIAGMSFDICDTKSDTDSPVGSLTTTSCASSSLDIRKKFSLRHSSSANSFLVDNAREDPVKLHVETILSNAVGLQNPKVMILKLIPLVLQMPDEFWPSDCELWKLNATSDVMQLWDASCNRIYKELEDCKFVSALDLFFIVWEKFLQEKELAQNTATQLIQFLPVGSWLVAEHGLEEDVYDTLDSGLYEGTVCLHGGKLVKSGNGKLFRTNGDEIHGFWKKGKLIKGIVKLSDGSVFEGKLNNDKFVNGTLTLADGRIFSGHFQNGVLHGVGSMTDHKGRVYEGDWEFGKLRIGTSWSLLREKFCGEFADILDLSKLDDFDDLYLTGSPVPWNGRGSLMTSEGLLLEGSWKEGVFYPEETAIFKFLSFLTGSKWSQVDSEGQHKRLGVFTHSVEEFVFAGELRGSRLLWNGDALHAYEDGSIYKGSFKRGEWNGFGVWIVPGSFTFIGRFIDTKVHGDHVIQFADGDLHTGTWNMNFLQSSRNKRKAVSRVAVALRDDGVGTRFVQGQRVTIVDVSRDGKHFICRFKDCDRPRPASWFQLE